MKKMILLATGFAVLITGAYCTSYLFAQTPAGGAAATQVQGTKVAVVNIGLIFNKYKRAQIFKRELEQTLDQPRKEAKRLVDEIVGWEKELQDRKLDPRVKDAREASIRENKRKLEDLNLSITKLLGKKSEENLVTLWKEVNMGVEAVSKAYGFQIVLGYGDPMEKDLLNNFPNVNRKMQAMDQGSTVPLFVHGSVDLSEAVANTLNRWIEPTTPAPVTPTSGQRK